MGDGGCGCCASPRRLLLEQLNLRLRGRGGSAAGRKRDVGIPRSRLGRCGPPAQRVRGAGKDRLGRDQVRSDRLGREELRWVSFDGSISRNSGSRSNIVNIDCDAVNRYRELSSLAPLAIVFLAEDLASQVATRAVGAIEGAGQCLKHIWCVYLKFCRHLKSAVAAWLRIGWFTGVTTKTSPLAPRSSTGRKKRLLHKKKLSGAGVQARLIGRAVHH